MISVAFSDSRPISCFLASSAFSAFGRFAIGSADTSSIQPSDSFRQAAISRAVVHIGSTRLRRLEASGPSLRTSARRVVGQFEPRREKRETWCLGSPAFRSLPSPRKVEGDAAASVQVGGVHAATTEESWQDRARPKPLLTAETRGSGDPCLESPLPRSCWPPGHWVPGYVEVHPKRTERKQWSDSGGGVSLTLGRTLAYRQRRLLQPSEPLQLIDAGPRQRACAGLIGARWQLPEP